MQVKMKKPDDSTESSHTIPCHDTVSCLEFSHYNWSSQLLAVGTSSRVTIFQCRFQEEDAEISGIDFKIVREFQTNYRSTSIAFSPETSLDVLPKVLSFATAQDDYNLRLYTSNLKDEDEVSEFAGHTSYVNCVRFHPGREDTLIASTGDDLTCRVWNKAGAQVFSFPLTAPGMTVCWHEEEPMKLLVGQKDGTIRIFSLHKDRCILSLSCNVYGLLAADWSLLNPLMVAAVAGTDLMLFDTSMSSLPMERRQAHTEGARLVRWSPCHEGLLATMGCPGNQIKVFNTRHQQLHVNASLKIAHGLTWHKHLPVLAVGGDKQVHLWVIESV